LKKLIEDYLHG